MSDSSSLMQSVEEALASPSLQIPVYSTTVSRLQGTVAREDADPRKVEQVLSHDPALATQVLRVANSPFYGGLSKISTISGATQRLGQRQIVNIALLTAQRAAHASSSPCVKSLMQRLWQHSVGCAIGSKWLAEHANFGDLSNDAFMIGLLHDVGALLLLGVLEALGANGNERSMRESLVLEVISAHHAEQGARLIKRWGLPDAFAKVVATHHDLEPGTDDTMAQLVRLADQACHKIGIALSPDPSIRLSTLPECHHLRMREIDLANLEIAIEDGVAALA